MVNDKELIDGFIEFLEGGLDEEDKQRYKLAVTAYFKAITQICDLIILRKKGYSPSSHTNRFRILEREFKEIYDSVDSIFKTYQDTYSMPISKESCNVIKNEIKKIIRIGNLEEEFKGNLSKF